MGAMAREKGARGEREAAKKLTALFGIEASRGVQFQGGSDSPDIRHTIADVHIEVKRTESLRLWAALGQAIADAGEKVPIVMHRPNNRDWVIVCRADDLGRLATQIYLTMAANPQ